MRAGYAAVLLTSLTALAACEGGLGASGDGPFAPGVARRGQEVDQLLVGHRLMAAGEYELALRAFTRAALDQGMTLDILSGMGSANLGLGRLGQSEKLLRRALKEDETAPEIWNNLGVVLMEKRDYVQAEQMFRRAFALDNGRSVSIRDNLRLALAKSENPDYSGEQEQDYKLVRRGSSDFLIRQIP
ncbi:MAG: hypothetical protein CSA70_11785 [Rhodobacterales bacterium]|nr:MAG: hypothetical protein CSA70_11785 [Rhodobacterales bacterium]